MIAVRPLRRTPRARTLAAALALVLVPMLAACGGDDGPSAGDGQETVTVTTPAPAQQATTERDDDTTATRPRDRTRTDDDRCRRLNRTGPIDMAGAGSVRLNRSGGRLSVSRVRPNRGWRADVERDDDRDEVKVEFRRGDREVELEAEIDDGRLRC